MNRVMMAVLALGLASVSFAAEETAPAALEKPPVEKASEKSEPVPAKAAVSTEKTEAKPVEEKAAAEPIKEAPKAESVQAETVKTETSKSVAAPAVEAAKAAPSFVGEVNTLVGFHEKEIASLKQLTTRWDAKVGATLKRQHDLQSDLKAKNEKIVELKKTNTKASKNEASKLSKEVSRINKDLQAVAKELKTHRGQLATELKTVGRDSNQAMKDAYQESILKMQTGS